MTESMILTTFCKIYQFTCTNTSYAEPSEHEGDHRDAVLVRIGELQRLLRAFDVPGEDAEVRLHDVVLQMGQLHVGPGPRINILPEHKNQNANKHDMCTKYKFAQISNVKINLSAIKR